MYFPRTWATLAEQVAAAMRGSGEPILNAIVKTVESDVKKKAKTSMSTDAVMCADGPELGGLGGIDLEKAIEAMVEENRFTYEKVSSLSGCVSVSVSKLVNRHSSLEANVIARFLCVITGNQGILSALLVLSTAPTLPTPSLLLETQPMYVPYADLQYPILTREAM